MQDLIIIIAAGESARLGTPKQLVKIGQESLLNRAIRIAHASRLGKLVVVLGYENQKIAQSIDNQSIKLAINPNWKDGMGTSIACGISKFATSKSIKGAYILLVDQYLLTVDQLIKMKATIDYYGDKIVASKYNQGQGPPVYFPQHLFSELTQMKGDQGARSMLKNNPEVKWVDFEEGSEDVDLPSDLEKIKKMG